MKYLPKKFLFALLACGYLLSPAARADEGMWLPMFIERLNYTDMQEMGLQLTAEEIYSVNSSSLKDAIVMLSGGQCTAELVSAEGLTLTNHHCAFEAIQSHSSVENDYLTDGFWAMQRDAELPVEGMTASVLVRMEDVTARVLEGVNDGMSEEERGAAVQSAMQQLQQEATQGTDYDAKVKGFFDGNEYYLFVYETFRDVRLVGAPPQSIGKYGGDTDNWMWPRHTGDFAVLRVYAGTDGRPADYAAENRPMRPRRHLSVSLDGVREGDFTMVMGFPGSTDRYRTSFGNEMALDVYNPAVVHARRLKLDVLDEAMAADDAVRIAYASKHARIANYWKYFIGQSEGLKRLGVVDQKRAEEEAFEAWVAEDPARQAKYGDALRLIRESTEAMRPYQKSLVYLNEAAFGSDLMQLAYNYYQLHQSWEQVMGNEQVKERVRGNFKAEAEDHFGDYHLPTDRRLFAAMMRLYVDEIPADQQPDVVATIKKKYKGDVDKYAAKVYDKSIFATQERTLAFLNEPDLKALEKDLGFQAISSVMKNYFENIKPAVAEHQANQGRGERLYVAGLRAMQPDRSFYPNANSTLRLSYGTVGDYYPRDAVKYEYFTTLEGVIEKEDPTNPTEFTVPEKLKELYEAKDYGPYGEEGELPVGFISNNDITGGNSGSPVMNGRGELIGIAFDGNWEAMSGDIAFEPELQRTISVDIRYVLFIIDKFAGAGHLVEEMTLVRGEREEAQQPAVEMESAGE
ncbi:MAG: S46 family peptidase [Catalinimonas sp.]